MKTPLPGSEGWSCCRSNIKAHRGLFWKLIRMKTNFIHSIRFSFHADKFRGSPVGYVKSTHEGGPNMRPRLGDIWNLKRLPARLNLYETGALLGFAEDNVYCLVKHKLLKPLVESTHGNALWFSAAEIGELYRDSKWLARATKIAREHIKARNDRQKVTGRLRQAAITSATLKGE
jgi:hypothetical protein